MSRCNTIPAYNTWNQVKILEPTLQVSIVKIVVSEYLSGTLKITASGDENCVSLITKRMFFFNFKIKPI